MYKWPSEPAYHVVDCRISKFQHRMVHPKDVRNLNGLCFSSFSKKVSFVQISLQKMKKEKKMYKRPSKPAYYIVYCRISKFQHNILFTLNQTTLLSSLYEYLSKKIRYRDLIYFIFKLLA